MRKCVEVERVMKPFFEGKRHVSRLGFVFFFFNGFSLQREKRERCLKKQNRAIGKLCVAASGGSVGF